MNLGKEESKVATLSSQFMHDPRLSKLKRRGEEWPAYWRLLILIHDGSDDGRVTYNWHKLTHSLGFGRRNATLFRILKKFHEKGIIVWENYREFAERIPVEARERLGVGPEVGVSDRGTMAKGKMRYGRLIYDQVTLFAPQVVEVLKYELDRISQRFRNDFKPCCHLAECQFWRSIGKLDRCSDPALSVTAQELREALEE